MTNLVPTSPLLDLLPRPPGHPSDGVGVPQDTSEERAAPLIDFVLAEYERLAELDAALGHVSIRYADRQAASAMRRLYQRWAEQADGLLQGLRAQGLRQRLPAAYDRLERVVGRTQAMLSVTLEALERADEQVRKGETVSSEEVRRELRARSHA